MLNRLAVGISFNQYLYPAVHGTKFTRQSNLTNIQYSDIVLACVQGPFPNSDSESTTVLRVSPAGLTSCNVTGTLFDTHNLYDYPVSPFPYTRLAVTNSPDNRTFYLYHQLDESTMAEDAYDIQYKGWIPKNISIHTG